MADDSFPQQQARTRRFTLGAPRAFSISPDGHKVLFLRTKAGDDPVTCLWEADAGTGQERLLADPRALGNDEDNLPPEERARRERVRESAGGIVTYACDKHHTLAVFPLSGQVYAVSLTDPAAQPELLPTQVPALDPRPDPTGTRVAYVHGGTLRTLDLRARTDTPASPTPHEPSITYGLAEFIAAEEMHRTRGFWWSPDGTRILVQRTDDSLVQRWHIADPANPGRQPNVVAYPAAGTPNADVSLFITTVGTSADDAAEPVLTPLRWDTDAFPYLVTVSWADRLLITVLTRDQTVMRLIDGETGEVLREERDPAWVDIVPGVPAQLADGRVVWTTMSEDTHRLVVAAPAELTAAPPLTPAGLQVRSVLATDGDTVYFSASREPTEVGVYAYDVTDGRLTDVETAPGVHGATASGGTTVISGAGLEQPGRSVLVRKKGGAAASIASLAQQPNLPAPRPHFLAAGPGQIRTAVLFPSWHEPGSGPLPVLMDPYGGPHAQQVLKTRGAFNASQWFAEQGFAVVIADGRGTPGRGPAWDRTVKGDLATPALEDQVTALRAAADAFGDLDLGRVGIRGWSFGGFLSALAVLRRPDVFHVGIAGAPVTDWWLYDTCYTERYLGDPATAADAYHSSSLHAEATEAPRRSLLIIHGLADDNVVVAHSLRLSSQLLAAGYPHSVLPLSGVTHMTPQEVVAENLLLLQVAFLKQALGTAAV
ncbi:MAG TPA: prolyl oligopeptidase family serine peptidase [Trebonia sp.]|nr:prolyl oligopeptidase family serine peptidase [Trebonia sp.]